jgi:hypothetical protein
MFVGREQTKMKRNSHLENTRKLHQPLLMETSEGEVEANMAMAMAMALLRA